MKNPLKFIQEVKQETFRITWPTKKDTTMGAIMVFALASIAAIFFLFLDQILRFLLNLVLTINFQIMNWYIVQAYSGFEKKVVESIKVELKKNNLDDNIGEILVPTHQITQIKKGKRTKKESKYFPGYVLLKVELTKQIYHLIKNLTKVSGFLGSGDKPTPISDTEIQRILGQVSENADNQKTGISFEIGEKVKVCDGPFASFNGLIEEIDEEKSRLKVSVSIFGRATPVDLEFNQVEKNQMAKEITGYVKLQIKGGQANPAPPVGPALG